MTPCPWRLFVGTWEALHSHGLAINKILEEWSVQNQLRVMESPSARGYQRMELNSLLVIANNCMDPRSKFDEEDEGKPMLSFFQLPLKPQDVAFDPLWGKLSHQLRGMKKKLVSPSRLFL